MVTSHTEALNKLYGPLDHLCESHMIQPRVKHKSSGPSEGLKYIGENTDGGSWRKTKRKQPVAPLTCVEERVINANSSRGEQLFKAI